MNGYACVSKKHTLHQQKLFFIEENGQWLMPKYSGHYVQSFREETVIQVCYAQPKK